MPRDSSGNYTLPLGNPVVDGTIIDVDWANPTMSDVAVQLNNVLTRDGLLSPILPFKLVDGSLAAPGLSFSAEPGLGLYRKALNTAAFVSDGTEVALFKNNLFSVSVPSTFASTLTVTGTLTASGNLTVNGTFTSAGVLSIPAGTAAAPGLFFTTDSNTGLYSPGADHVGVSTGGVSRLIVDPNGTVTIAAPSAATNTLTLKTSSAGVTLDLHGVASGAEPSGIRFFNNDGSVPYGGISGSGAGLTFSSATAGGILVFETNSTTRLTLTAAGDAIFAENVGIGIAPFPTTPIFVHVGTDQNFGTIVQGGALSVGGFTDLGTGAKMRLTGQPLVLSGDAGTTDNATINGNGQLLIGTTSNVDVGAATVPKLIVTGSTVADAASVVYCTGANNTRMAAFADNANNLVGWIMEASATQPNYVWRRVSTELMRLTYSGELGIGCTPPSTVPFRVQVVGNNDVGIEWQRLNATTGVFASYNRASSAYATLQSHALDFTWHVSGIEKLRLDTTGALGLGTTASGALFHSASGSSTPAMRAQDAGPNQGTLVLGNYYLRGGDDYTGFRFQTAGGASTLLSLDNGNGQLTDGRGLTYARDPGTTSSIPIGGIICAELTSGAPCNALATKDAATNNLSIKGTSSGGTNITVSTGTFRNIGATGTSTVVCMWQRIS